MDDIGTLEGMIGSITQLTSDLAPREIARPTNKVFQKDPLASQEVDIVRSRPAGRLIITRLFYRAAGALPMKRGKIPVKICYVAHPGPLNAGASAPSRGTSIGPTLRSTPTPIRRLVTVILASVLATPTTRVLQCCRRFMGVSALSPRRVAHHSGQDNSDAVAKEIRNTPTMTAGASVF